MNKSDSMYRLLAFERILTDKPQTSKQIIERLENEYGFSCDRKTVYRYASALTRFANVQVSQKGIYVEKMEERK